MSADACAIIDRAGVSDELELFAARMYEGLLAAAVAVGLEVFDQLLDANVTAVAAG